MTMPLFLRRENKYIIDRESYERLFGIVSANMTPDPHGEAGGPYTVCSIYFDSPDDDLIKKSLSQPAYKEKLRLRSYGVPGRRDYGYLEIKKKVLGRINKRRVRVRIGEAYNFVHSRITPEHTRRSDRQVLEEIAVLLLRYDLRPKVYIAYERRAFFLDDLRVTFDAGIRTRRSELDLESGDYGRPLFGRDLLVMEIKAERTMPFWLARTLTLLGVHASGFSKYGAEYLSRFPGNTVAFGNMKGVEPCLNQSSRQPALRLA